MSELQYPLQFQSIPHQPRWKSSGPWEFRGAAGASVDSTLDTPLRIFSGWSTDTPLRVCSGWPTDTPLEIQRTLGIQSVSGFTIFGSFFAVIGWDLGQFSGKI